MKISKSNATNYTVVLADGTFLDFHYVTGHTTETLSLNKSFYYDGLTSGCIYVDIDGENKGKNELGKDMFKFDILNTGIMPEGQDTSKGKPPCVSNKYCTAWVIEHENMDYLKCYDKLKWGEQTTCK